MHAMSKILEMERVREREREIDKKTDRLRAHSLVKVEMKAKMFD